MIHTIPYGGDIMYYIKIIHKKPLDIEFYYSYEYFSSKEAAEEYYTGVFMPMYYNPDLCYVVSGGEAHWSPLGVLTPDEE